MLAPDRSYSTMIEMPVAPQLAGANPLGSAGVPAFLYDSEAKASGLAKLFNVEPDRWILI